MNKKAIELSINFLVIIIISLAILSMGIIFLNKIIRSASEKVHEMDVQTKEELARLLDQGDKVAMPFFQKSVIHGNTATFGLGVLNTLEPSKFYSGKVNKFKIIIKFDKAYDKTDTEICKVAPCDPDGSRTGGGGWLAYDKTEHEIKMNDQGKYTIAISPPKDADPGTYIFNVAVCYTPADAPDNAGEDSYDSATTVCGGTYTINGGWFGYYNLQKIWLSVK